MVCRCHLAVCNGHVGESQSLCGAGGYSRVNEASFFDGACIGHRFACDGVVIVASVVGGEPYGRVSFSHAVVAVGLPFVNLNVVRAVERLERLVDAYQGAVGGEGYVAQREIFARSSFCAELAQNVACLGVENENSGRAIFVECKYVEVLAPGYGTLYVLAGECVDGLVPEVLFQVVNSLCAVCRQVELVRVCYVVDCRWHVGAAFELNGGICRLACSNAYFHRLGFLVVRVGYFYGVNTRFDIAEHVSAIVIVVGGVGGDLLVALLQYHGGAVDGKVEVGAVGVGLVLAGDEFFVPVAHYAVDGAFLVGKPEIISDATGVGIAFHIVHVPVHGSLACRLVCVEIAFHEEPGNFVLERSEVSVGARSGVEIEVAAYIGIGAGVIAPYHMLVVEAVGPACLCHHVGFCHLGASLACVVASVEV